MGEQIFGKEGNDAGSSLSNAGTTSPLHGENRSTTEDQYPSDGDGEVVRNECSSVFAAGGASPGGVGRDGGQDSKHQQGRRRHDLSLVRCNSRSVELSRKIVFAPFRVFLPRF